MYSFSPIPDVPVDHVGMFIVCMTSAFILCVVLMNEPDVFFRYFFFVTLAIGITYIVSYHLTDQSPKVYKNEKVTAELVGFQPEGYREKSGKSMVDKHYMYIVYRVNGNEVILQATQGVEYPKTAILYKN
jgi:hypothetical protein